MRYPRLTGKTIRRKSLNRFYGYDRNSAALEGSFTQTENLSTALYPLLSTRKKRSTVARLNSPQGLAEKDAPAWVDAGTLYFNGLATPVSGLSEGEKQLVGMGAYLCIFPDKYYFNTADASDYGSMEASWTYSGAVSYTMCSAQGEEYGNVSYGDAQPSAPEEGELWLSEGLVSRWSEESGQWIALESVYTKLRFTTQGQVPSKFSVYDGVELQGCHEEVLNGNKIIYGIGGRCATAPDFADAEQDYIIVQGEPIRGGSFDNESISIKRKVPNMDYVCQCRNRLWGCRYGNDGKGNINELYACALGDFKNWNQFLGLSTDSWTAGVGSDGVWTGAVNYLGTPIFFKENCLHRISVSPIGAHEVDETVCRGVEKGSAKSLAVVNETLFYKSPGEVCAYQGAFPESVSSALGERRYHAAAAGAVGQFYYISMIDEQKKPQLFVYDIAHGLWSREDGLRAEFFTVTDGKLYCISENALICLDGGNGQEEERLRWSCETGLVCLEQRGKKYLNRICANMILEDGGECEFFVQYDCSDIWEYAGRISESYRTMGRAEIALKLRGCDSIRLKLSGVGRMKLMSVQLEVTEG